MVPQLMFAPLTLACCFGAQLKHDALKGAVSAVPQYVNLVNGSVAANIAFAWCALCAFHEVRLD